ncbi:hypothetical protein COO60DRAFT_1664767 [Scenedesmus sp. NREL 46B-D3]|nr:hypothetical protein COO60DRAFT_1664767 [Scenedesmus sp. NREL 46B-D3]
MAAAAAGMGDTEVAYCLYAKGCKICGTAAADPAVQPVVQQLAAGKLQMLAALCQVPGEDQRQQQQQHEACKRWQRMQERFHLTSTTSSSSSSSSSSSTDAAGSRVFCVSDLHVDKAGGANMSWLQRISSSVFMSDVLIVAGDVADTAAAVAAALRLLSARFRRVVWLPGNHEAWLRPGSRDTELYTDSFAKLLALRQMADECGVDVGPVEVQPGLIVLPLLSWYRAAFDASDPRPGRYRHDGFCSWPVPDDDVWQVMMRLNSAALALVQARIAQQQQRAVQQQQGQRQPLRHAEQQLAAMALAKQPPPPQQQQQQQCDVALAVASAATASFTADNISRSSSSVTWNERGVLAVQSSRRVPGLQLNLKPAQVRGLRHLRSQRCQQQQQQQQQHQQEAEPHKVQQQQLHQKVQLAAAAAAAVPAAAGANAAPVRLLRLLPAARALPLLPAAVTVITASHFLPHPQLPYSRFSELGRAMGCCELQLQLEQVSSAVHVYGHSHINADMDLPTAAALDAIKPSKPEANQTHVASVVGGSSSSSSSSSSSRRYVQYALDAVGSEAAGLYCLWDGSSLAAPGNIVPIAGP